jgi:hypothetical protein
VLDGETVGDHGVVGGDDAGPLVAVEVAVGQIGDEAVR